MILLRCNWLPKLFSVQAIFLFPFLIIHRDAINDKVLLSHERIHLAQCLEMLIVFFYLWYVIEFGIKFLGYLNYSDTYYAISFEREAYEYQSKPDLRRWYGWVRYLLRRPICGT